MNKVYNFAVAANTDSSDAPILNGYIARSKEEAIGMFILDQLGANGTANTRYLYGISVTCVGYSPHEDTALAELYKGRRIKAIVAVRNETGWGLKESKAFVDGIMARHNITDEVLKRYRDTYNGS